jgi:hypothetical protein
VNDRARQPKGVPVGGQFASQAHSEADVELEGQPPAPATHLPRLLVDGDLAVELDHIGEGYGGDYDPDDPADAELLRFTVMRRVDGVLEPVDDGSYCTKLPATISAAEAERASREILKAARDGDAGGDLKRRLEEQSHLSPVQLTDDRDLAATIENAAGNWVEYLGDQGRDGEADELNEALVEMGRRRTARRDPEDLLNHVRSVILSEVEGLGGWEDDGVEVAPAGSGADHAAILYRVMAKLDLMPESQIPKAQSFTGGELGPEERQWVSDFMERALASEHDDGLYDEAERLGRLYPDLWDNAGEG